MSTSDWGYIDAEAAEALGVEPGPIRLFDGVPGAKGYGLLHIESNEHRMKQIAGLGYKSASAFVADVATGWTKIIRGEDERSLVLVRPKGGYDLRIVVRPQASELGTIWSVTTGIPSRVARGDVLYEKKDTAG